MAVKLAEAHTAMESALKGSADYAEVIKVRSAAHVQTLYYEYIRRSHNAPRWCLRAALKLGRRPLGAALTTFTVRLVYVCVATR